MKNLKFDEIYNILEQSFEPYLHRGYEKQKKLLNNENYNIITEEKDGKILGFLSYWKIENNVFFVEHFAVNPEMRGNGIGKKIFRNFLKLDGEKILEVEPPHTDIDKKRIKLYEDFGLIFHKNEYYQPPYNKGDKKTKLHIMCTSLLKEKEFNDIIYKIHKLVYNVN